MASLRPLWIFLSFRPSWSTLVFPVLCLSRGFLHGVFCGFLPSFWALPLESLSLPAPCGSPTHGPFRLGPSSLGWGPFRYALLLACASAPECLFRHWAPPSLPSSRFVSPSAPSYSLFQSALHFYSTHWFLRSLPLLLLFLPLPRLLRGLLLLLLSRVQCSGVCCFSCGGVLLVLVLPFGVLSLVLVCFALILSACSPVSSGHGGS